MKLIFATNNQHKLQEAQAILGKHVNVVSLKDIDCHDDIPETEVTLEGNSRLKAQYIHTHWGVDCFADDTGLEIEALNGEPGVYSARYASLDVQDKEHNNAQTSLIGQDADARNRAKVLCLMNDTMNRKARFRTVITLILHEKEYQFEGIVQGEITRNESGTSGFGYDSIFIPEGYTQTFAELTADEKNKISHRGRALAAFQQFLDTQH